jgi:hypothetical protein
MISIIMLGYILDNFNLKKGLYLDQRLPQHESLYPIGLKSAKIEIPHIGFNYIDFSKTDSYYTQKQLYSILHYFLFQQGDSNV